MGCPFALHALTRYCEIVLHAEVCRQIERTIELQGSLRRAAAAFRVSPQYLSAVLLGEKTIGPKILTALKLRKVVTVTYEPRNAKHR